MYPRLAAGVLALMVGIGVSSARAQTVVYVDSDAAGPNNSSSWADGFNDPQDALDAAVAGDQIRVAAGPSLGPVRPTGRAGKVWRSYQPSAMSGGGEHGATASASVGFAFGKGGGVGDDPGGVAGGPPNNDCANAVPISDGVTPFSTIGATTDGPDMPGHSDCDAFLDDNVNQDTWYDYTATCTST